MAGSEAAYELAARRVQDPEDERKGREERRGAREPRGDARAQVRLVAGRLRHAGGGAGPGEEERAVGGGEGAVGSEAPRLEAAVDGGREGEGGHPALGSGA